MNVPFKTRIFKARLINKINNFSLVQYDRSLILVQNAVQNILHTWPAEKLKTILVIFIIKTFSLTLKHKTVQRVIQNIGKTPVKKPCKFHYMNSALDLINPNKMARVV